MAISFSSAIDFTMISPDEVLEGGEFDVTINADTTDTYDIKIFVTNEAGKYGRANIVSEIYFDGQWKDPWFYLPGVFPQHTSFQNRVLNFSGETEICGQLRLNGQSTYTRVCNPLTVNGNSGSSNSNNENTNNQNSNEDEEGDEDNSSSLDVEGSSQSPQSVDLNSLAVDAPAPAPSKKIVLNAPSKETKSKIQGETTVESKVRTSVVYGFIGLCVILIILLALKKL